MTCFNGRQSFFALATACTLTVNATANALPLTRGKAVELALKQNPQIAAARAVEAQAAAHGDQAAAAGLPSISIAAAVGPSLTARLVQGSAAESTRSSTDIRAKDFSVVVGGELQILQPLYTFGKISERKRAAALEHKAREAQTSLTKADIAFDVAGYYEAFLFARDAERFFQEMERWLQRITENTEEEIKTGKGPNEQDLLRLGTAMGVVHMGLHQTEAVKQQTEGALSAYLALPRGQHVEPTEETLELLPVSADNLETLKNRALSERPEVRGVRAAIGAYEALAEAEAAGNLPDFFALASLSVAYTPGRQWLDSRYLVDPLNHFVPVLLVGARWQWNGGMASARAAENRAQALELQHKAEWAQTAIPAEVNKAFQSVERAQRDAEEAEKTVAMAKKWMVQASADYSVGVTDSRNVAEAAQAYVQMRLAYFDANYRHNVARAELAKVTGTLDASASPYYPNRAESGTGTSPAAATQEAKAKTESGAATEADAAIEDDAATDAKAPAEAKEPEAKAPEAKAPAAKAATETKATTDVKAAPKSVQPAASPEAKIKKPETSDKQNVPGKAPAKAGPEGAAGSSEAKPPSPSKAPPAKH